LTLLSAKAEKAEKIAAACQAMAQRFHQGGRLLAMGTGPFATGAQHLSVEFVHPVILGKRAVQSPKIPRGCTHGFLETGYHGWRIAIRCLQGSPG
jgi:D-sedoheptulose 7-phosphate isomerase